MRWKGRRQSENVEDRRNISPGLAIGGIGGLGGLVVLLLALFLGVDPQAKVYIDLAFYQEMKSRLGAPGDFAQAYVIAHEVGHHVQNLLGISDRVHAQQGRVSKTEGNELSVRLELQADFFAGVWAHHAQQNWRILEPGDIEEALNAATAIGDDRLQKQSRGYVVPESFTHGTSEQRTRWFSRGLKTGDMERGDTFALAYQSL